MNIKKILIDILQKWMLSLMDTNNDNIIDADEFLNFVKKLIKLFTKRTKIKVQFKVIK